MKHLKTIALAAFMTSAATVASGFDVTSHPIVSDGNTAIAMHPSSGSYEVRLCGTDYWIADSNSFKIFNKMKARLQSNGGYIYQNTDAPGNKRWYSCAWGRYEHLHGELF